MNLVTINEATEELGISADELLRAVMERRIPRPGKFFGWPPEQFSYVRTQFRRRAEPVDISETTEKTNEQH